MFWLIVLPIYVSVMALWITFRTLVVLSVLIAGLVFSLTCTVVRVIHTVHTNRRELTA